METTKIYKNWSRPDVFEVSREMMRDFARAGGIVMNSTDVSEIIEFGAYVIVSASSSFGQGYDGVKFGTYINSEFSTYLDVQEHMQKTAAYYDSFEIDNILKDNIWTDFPIANHYEVWHLVDTIPDWLSPVMAYSEYMRGADSYLRYKLASFLDVTVASDYKDNSAFVEMYVVDPAHSWELVGLMRMPWKSHAMGRIFDTTARVVSGLGFSFAFRRFDVMRVHRNALSPIVSRSETYVCMSEDYANYMEAHKFDPAGSYVDDMRRGFDSYDNEIPF